jgi:hypothetical protein
MGLRDLARKGLGLFVVMEDDPSAEVAVTPVGESGSGSAPPATKPAGDKPAAKVGTESDSEYVKQLRSKSVGDLLKELEGPEPEQIQKAVQAGGPALPAVQGGKVDFPAIYSQAQISPMPFGAEQTLELIQSYPSDMPLPIRRQALDATLKTMGRAMNLTKEAIVADASRKINALAAFEETAKRERDTAVSAAQEKFKQLQAQIQAEQAKAAAVDQQYRAIVEQCEAEGHRLDQVQEFLTLDQPAAPPPSPP